MQNDDTRRGAQQVAHRRRLILGQGGTARNLAERRPTFDLGVRPAGKFALRLQALPRSDLLVNADQFAGTLAAGHDALQRIQ